MFTVLRKVFKDCTTEVDGKTYCMFRVGGGLLTMLSVPAFIGLTIYSTVRPEHRFDMIAFGTAFGAMMGGIGMLAGGVAFKARGELHDDDAMNRQN
jgi:hypothetical protein